MRPAQSYWSARSDVVRKYDQDHSESPASLLEFNYGKSGLAERTQRPN